MKRTKMDDRYCPGGLRSLTPPSIYSQTKKTTEMRVPATASITGTVKVSIPFAFSVAGKSFEVERITLVRRMKGTRWQSRASAARVRSLRRRIL